jgi:hypothetical protein
MRGIARFSVCMLDQNLQKTSIISPLWCNMSETVLRLLYKFCLHEQQKSFAMAPNSSLFAERSKHYRDVG